MRANPKACEAMEFKQLRFKEAGDVTKGSRKRRQGEAQKREWYCYQLISRQTARGLGVSTRLARASCRRRIRSEPDGTHEAEQRIGHLPTAPRSPSVARGDRTSLHVSSPRERSRSAAEDNCG